MGEVNSNDTYLKDELSRIRRENESLLEQVQDLSKRLTMLDRDKKDIEKKLSNVKLQQKSMIGSNDQVDHYRSQLGHVRSQFLWSVPEDLMLMLNRWSRCEVWNKT